MKIEDFVQQNKQFEIPTQYYRVGKDWETYVCFYNYFDQIFPKDDVGVTLHLFFFNLNGEQIAYGTEKLSVHDSRSVACSRFLAEGEGLVAAAAIPEKDLAPLAEGKFNLRGQISTGYYTMWESKQTKTMDISHEWASLQKTPGSREHVFHSNFNASSTDLQRQLIVINPNLKFEEGSSVPSFKIYKNSKFVGNFSPELKMHGRAVQVLDVDQVLKTLNISLDVSDNIAVSTIGKNITVPLTVENIRGSDFHIHHV